MNIKIARTMLVLCGLYIVGFYILKFVFPDKLLLIVVDPNILQIGALIDGNPIYLHICNIITTFITFYLFVCASRGSFKLNWKDLILLIAGVAINKCVAEFLPELYTHTSISIMLLLAMFCNGKKEYFVPAFVIYGFAEQFLLSIRGFETIIVKMNSASAIVLMLECWVWLVMFALLFYLMEKRNGTVGSPLSRERN